MSEYDPKKHWTDVHLSPNLGWVTGTQSNGHEVVRDVPPPAGCVYTFRYWEGEVPPRIEYIYRDPNDAVVTELKRRFGPSGFGD